MGQRPHSIVFLPEDERKASLVLKISFAIQEIGISLMALTFSKLSFSVQFLQSYLYFTFLSFNFVSVLMVACLFI